MWVISLCYIALAIIGGITYNRGMNISQIRLDIVINTDNDDYHYTGGILRITWALRKHVTEKGFRMTVKRIA